MAAFNQLLGNKERILDDCRLMQNALTDCEGIDRQIAELEQEIEVVTELTKRCIAENAKAALSQAEYNIRYNGLVQRYNTATASLESLQKTKADREVKADTIGEFIFRAQELDALTEFDEKLWLTTIETVTVHADGRMTFKFQGGTEIDV